MRLLLLEDEEVFAEALGSHLKKFGFTTDTVQSIADAETALRTADFGLALFDLNLPDGDGQELIRKLRAAGNSIPIIAVTARDQITDRIHALEAGADDYLIKPFDVAELKARIVAVVRRYEGHSSSEIRLGRLVVDKSGHRVLINNKDALLSAKEWVIVERLTAKPGAIVSKDQLESTIYSFDSEISSNTVEVYISKIRKKLGKDYIETVRGLGYRFNFEK